MQNLKIALQPAVQGAQLSRFIKGQYDFIVLKAALTRLAASDKEYRTAGMLKA